jgi:hypothetical protein
MKLRIALVGLLCMLFAPDLLAQRYSSEDLLTLSDRTLKDKTDFHMVKCFTYNKAQSFYSTKKRSGKIKYRKMPTGTKLKRHLNHARIVYDFSMPYADCPQWDTIQGRCYVTIKADSVLLIEEEPDLRFIPNFAGSYLPCHFISADKAIQLALADGLQSGIGTPYAYLSYQADRKRTVWVVLRTIWNNEDFKNDKPAKDDMVIIDAVNAWVLQHKVVPYAPR